MTTFSSSKYQRINALKPRNDSCPNHYFAWFSCHPHHWNPLMILFHQYPIIKKSELLFMQPYNSAPSVTTCFPFSFCQGWVEHSLFLNNPPSTKSYFIIKSLSSRSRQSLTHEVNRHMKFFFFIFSGVCFISSRILSPAPKGHFNFDSYSFIFLGWHPFSK